MNSITKSQLTALLLITDLFALICFKGCLSVWMMSGYAIGTALQFIAVMPFTALKRLPKWLSFGFMVYVLCYGSILLKRLWYALDVTFIPCEISSGMTGKLLITGMISLVCLYISSTGIKAAARSAVVISAAGILFLLIDLASALMSSKYGNLTASAGYGTVYDGIRLSFTASGLPVSMLALLPVVKRRKGAVLQYFSLRILICSALLMTTLLVTGGIMKTAGYPVILSAQLSQPLSTQRIDPLFLMLFAVFGVFSLTAQIMTAAYLAKEMFPSFRKWRTTVMISLVLLGSAAAVLLTGCSSSGKVHDKLYLRCIGIDGDSITMTFFNDDTVVNVKCEDIPEAKEMAELELGKPVVTGFTEAVLLGDCDAEKVLEYMLKTWKVSPSCMAVHDDTPHETLTHEDAEVLEGRIREKIKKGLSPPCGIVDVLENIYLCGRVGCAP